MANATTRSTLVAIFRDSSDAQAAADELKANGFPQDDIYVSSYSSSTTSGTGSYQGKQEGGIKGWFKSLFGEDDYEDDRGRYENAMNRGNVLLSVEASDENTDRAADILDKHDPIDVHQDAASVASASTGGTTAKASGTTAGAKTTKSRPSAGGTSTDLPKSIPVVQEDVRVGKRTVQRGGVRVYSRVVEQPVEESVQLQEERVRVERQPVNRAATGAELQAGRDQVIEVQEFAEEPVVSKEARVVEEVRISKDATERTETVRDKVRRTEVNVENLNESTTGRTSAVSSGHSTDYDDDFWRDYESNYASAGGKYDDYAPAYQYGYQAASDPRFAGRSWDQVESDLRSDYGQRYPNSTWERFKAAVHYGWDKVTGKSKSASSSSY